MTGIAALLDSDLEDNRDYLNENSVISSASEAEQTTALPVKKGKKRHRVTMPKPRAKVAKSSPAPVTKKPTKKSVSAKRGAIEAQMEESAIESHDALAEDDFEEVQPRTKGRGRTIAKTTTRKTAQPVAEARADDEEQAEIDHTPIVARSSHAQGRTTKVASKITKQVKAPPKKKSQPDPIPETQQSESMDIDSDVDELDVAATKATVKARPASRVRPEHVPRRRAGSASDTERGDPNLRRRLGDITRKFENVDIKYRNLKEVGVIEASSNVEKLRKQCEATTEASNNLVASLKQELALQAPLATESRKLKKDAQSYLGEIERLKAVNADMTTSLSTAQNEIKALQAKLAAARAHSAEPNSNKAVTSAVKPSSASRAITTGSSEALQIAQMKLDLYGDLTGLLVNGVKRAQDGDTYDCIQTGRNGTLHFKLFIDQEDAKHTSFQETEFLYMPVLDANRDRDMIELMPAYLAEDITFARQNAAKFYQRVVDTLSRRVADD